jgi:hypothetical protein
LLGVEDSDEGEVAVAFGIIETIAYYKLVGDGESHVMGPYASGASHILFEKNAGSQAFGF